MASLATEIDRLTTLRRAPAEDLAVHAGVGVADVTRDFYNVVQFPDVDPDEMLHAAVFFPSLESDLPVSFGAFVAAGSIEEFDHDLENLLDLWDGTHPEGGT
jgi:hypothetical protein